MRRRGITGLASRGRGGFRAAALLLGLGASLGACNLIFGIAPGEPVEGSGGTGGQLTTTDDTGGSTAVTTMVGGGGVGGVGGTGGTGGAGGAPPSGPDAEWVRTTVHQGNARAIGHVVRAKTNINRVFTAGTHEGQVLLADNGSGALTVDARGLFITSTGLAGTTLNEASFELESDGPVYGALYGMDVTDAGHVFVTGSVVGIGANIGDVIDVQSASFHKAFLARIDMGDPPQGTWGRLFWAPGVPDNGRQAGTRVVVDDNVDGCPGTPAYSVIVLAVGGGSLDFGDGPTGNDAEPSLWVAKWTAGGELCWERRFRAGWATADNELANHWDAFNLNGHHAALAVDPAHNIVVAGAMGQGPGGTTQTMYFCETAAQCESGSPVEIAALGEADYFVLKLNPFGKTKWGARVGGEGIGAANGSQWIDAVSAPSTGALYVTGAFTQGISWSAPKTFDLAGADPGDAFVARLDGDNGSVVWAARIGGQGRQRAMAISFDDTQHMVVTGTTEADAGGVIVEGPGAACPTLPSSGSADAKEDIWVMRFEDGVGDCLWAKRFGGPSSQVPFSVSLDEASHETYLSGFYTGSVDFGGATSPLSVDEAYTEAFLLKLGP